MTTPTDRDALERRARELADRYRGSKQGDSCLLNNADSDLLTMDITDAFLALRDEAVRAERERCAKIAEATYSDPGWNGHYRNAAVTIATAIRSPEPPAQRAGGEREG